MIKVILADDHQIILEGLQMLLEAERDIQIVGQAVNGKQVLNLLEKKDADIVVLDIEMPQMDGFKAAEIISEKHPLVKVLVLTMHTEQEFISGLLAIGASGYILKNRGKEELVTAIRKIAEGGQYFGEAVKNVLIKSLQQPKKAAKAEKVALSRREIEVLKLIAKGLSSIEIGEKLFIAPSTVDTHRRNLIDKTGVANSKALIGYAFQNGYAE